MAVPAWLNVHQMCSDKDNLQDNWNTLPKMCPFHSDVTESHLLKDLRQTHGTEGDLNERQRTDNRSFSSSWGRDVYHLHTRNNWKLNRPPNGAVNSSGLRRHRVWNTDQPKAYKCVQAEKQDVYRLQWMFSINLQYSFLKLSRGKALVGSVIVQCSIYLLMSKQ